MKSADINKVVPVHVTSRGLIQIEKVHYAFIVDVNVHEHGITVATIIVTFLVRDRKCVRVEKTGRDEKAKGGGCEGEGEKNGHPGQRLKLKSYRIDDAKEIYSQYLATLGSFPPPTSRKSEGRSLFRFFLRLLTGNL